MAANGLKEGYSTGSCAAAAAKAAALAALMLPVPEQVLVVTPEEKTFALPVQRFEDGSFGVIKDAGDDPDATNGMLIKASVEISREEGAVTFAAGEGVGVVTLPGLKIAPGQPAINPAPRTMIERALREVIGARAARVTISAPDGARIAKRTFNPRLGIVGGISILGTSGRVKPMNEASLLESLTLEINTHAAQGRAALALCFAGTGEKTLREAYGVHNRAVVQCGNYLGFALDECARLGIKELLIGGHPGKLLKAAAGSFNTHNRTGGGAKEALCTQAAICGAPCGFVKTLYDCTTIEEAMRLIDESAFTGVWPVLADIAARRCEARSFGDLRVEAAYIDNDARILGATDGAAVLARRINDDSHI
ncbi:MAG: cobalt-precorrin-5B (C(1))-methyltransferase CbiD [Cloacibacillus sp.]